MEFTALTSELVPAVERFHARIAAGGGPPYRFGTNVASGRLHPLALETFLAVDQGEVRGGVMIQQVPIHTSHGIRSGANIQLPLSEGVVDRRYASVGAWLIRQVLKRWPYAYAVGMGGTDRPLPRLLAAMQWQVGLVPFFFRIHRAGRVLREMPVFKGSLGRRLAATTLGSTGLGHLGVSLLNSFALARVQALGEDPVRAEYIPEWGAWVDDVWLQSRKNIGVALARDSTILPYVYPVDQPRLERFRLASQAGIVGWACVLITQMNESEYFGNLKVATILDIQALPGKELGALLGLLRSEVLRGTDLIISNQQHSVWQREFRRAGFLPGSSNYVLAASPAFAEAPGELGFPASVHVTRGDGDGRIHL